MQRQHELGARGDDDRLWPRARPDQRIPAPFDRRDLPCVPLDMRQLLAGKQQTGGAVPALNGGPPGNGGFHRISRPPQGHIRHEPEGRGLFHGLMGRAVLAEADGIVGKHEDIAKFHQRGHAQGVARVFGEHQKGARIRDKAAVQGEAVADRRHAELARAIMQIIAVFRGLADRRRTRPAGEIRAAQVSRAAQQLRQMRGKRGNGILRGLTGGHGLGPRRAGGDICFGQPAPVGGQLALQAALIFRGQFRVRRAVAGIHFPPCRFPLPAPFARVPGRVIFSRDHKRRVAPAQFGARPGDLFGAERRAVTGRAARLRGRAPADDRVAAKNTGAGLIGERLLQSLPDGLRVMPVNSAERLPAAGLEAGRDILAEPAGGVAVDRDPVAVIDHDQLAKPQCAGQRTDLVRYALHEAAVAHKGISVVIDDGEISAVEAGREHGLGQRHAHGIGQPLTERAGGRLDAGRLAVFRVAGRL